MKINLIDHLDKFKIEADRNTEYRLHCPVCDGIIALNKKTGSWLCVHANCNWFDIVSKVGIPLSRSISYEPKPKPFIQPLTLNRKCNLTKLSKYQESYETKIYRSQDGTVNVRTIYNYSDTQRVIRYDIFDNHEEYLYSNRKEKDFCVSTLVNGEWKIGGNLKEFCFYNQQYIEKGKDLLIVEGEKCAIAVTSRTGYLALSPAAGAWSEDMLSDVFSKLYWTTGDVLFIPDNDKVGKHKTETLQRACWRNKKKTKILDISPYVNENEDIADLINRDSKLAERLIDEC